MGVELLVAVPMLVVGQVLTSIVALILDTIQALVEQCTTHKASGAQWEQGLEARLSAALVAPSTGHHFYEANRGSPTRNRPSYHAYDTTEADCTPTSVDTMDLSDLSRFPVEIQLQILTYVASPLVGRQPTKVLRLSRGHHRVFERKVYRCISLTSVRAVERLRVTLVVHNPKLGQLVERIQLAAPLPEPIPADPNEPPAGTTGSIRAAQSIPAAMTAIWHAFCATVRRCWTSSTTRHSAEEHDGVDLLTLARHLEQILLAIPRVIELCVDREEGTALAVTGVWARVARPGRLLPSKLVTEMHVGPSSFPLSHQHRTRPFATASNRARSMSNARFSLNLASGRNGVLAQALFTKVEHIEVILPRLSWSTIEQLRSLPFARHLTIHWRPHAYGSNDEWAHVDPGDATELVCFDEACEPLRLVQDFARALQDLRQGPVDPDDDEQEDLGPNSAWQEPPYDKITIFVPPGFTAPLSRVVLDAHDLRSSPLIEPFTVLGPRKSMLPNAHPSDPDTRSAKPMAPIYIATQLQSQGVMRDWFVDRMARVWAW